MPALPDQERAFAVIEKPFDHQFAMNVDTIYQIDTVYQYEFIYDTLYYYDTIPQYDTLTSLKTNIEQTDTTVIINQSYELLVTERKMIFADKKSDLPDPLQRVFTEPGESEAPVVGEGKGIPVGLIPDTHFETQIQKSTAPPEQTLINLPLYLKDTIYRTDTIFNFEIRYDTVFFESNQRSDTTISNKTTYKTYGTSVLVKETVNLKVTQRERVFSQKPEHLLNSKNISGNKFQTRKTTSLTTSRSKSLLPHTSRLDKEKNYSGSFLASYSFFKPELEYLSQNDDYSEKIEMMNKKQVEENSFGISVTYNYLQEKTGFETGLGFSKYNCTNNHNYQQLNIDTSYYFEYFEKQTYQYDTTWYINLDTLLQTSDTLLVPHADSTIIWVSDSTNQMKFDSSYMAKSQKYKYSYSFLEIPVIGHFSIIEKRCFVRVAAGVIPMFLISKSESLSFPEANAENEYEEISFDYGFSLAFYGSAIFGLRLNDKWAIYAEPYIRQNIYSAISNDQLKVKTNSWGIKTGIAYRLFFFKSK